MTDRFDLIVIGAGPGGYEAALEAASLGKRVAVVEKSLLGGTCVNSGCIPTKALLRSSKLYHEALTSAEKLGITTNSPSYDMSAIHRYASDVRTDLRSGIDFLLKKAKVSIIPGKAVITAPGNITVGDTNYNAENILIATGSSPALPPIPGIKLPCVVTSDKMLSGDGIDCKKLVIIGGGVVGAEFAQIYSDLGCEVTIIEALPRILSGMDREISQNLTMILKKRGVQVHTGAAVTEIAEISEGLICRYVEKETALEAAADCILVCTGRRPNTTGICGEGLDLPLENGYIPVDQTQKTSVPGIYAVGDVVLGGVQLASAAAAQGKNAIHAMFGVSPIKNISLIPFTAFTVPEIAYVGLTADDAKAQEIKVDVRKSLTSANGKSRILEADRGFSKLVFDADTGVLLGAQLMCDHAAEIIGGLSAAISAGITEEQLCRTVFPHPTVSEIISL